MASIAAQQRSAKRLLATYAAISLVPVLILGVAVAASSIDADVPAGLHDLYRNLALGLAALYLTLLVISLSVSQRLREQLKLNKFLAEHDVLTDLPNRTLFHRRVSEVLARASRSGKRAVIAIMDLDRFKVVNDTLGHHSGDELLTQLARRLADSTRPVDAVARLGGDEFGMILFDISDAQEVLARLRGVVEHEVEVSGLPLSIESSIGFVIAPEDGTDVDELLQRADVAMYVAKAQHSGVARYDTAHDHYDAAKLGLVAQLRRAIENGELVLHYQPKATLANKQVEAVEALVRWQHPTEGLLYPDLFVPLAEQTDLIDKLTIWVLKTALSDIQDLGPDIARVAVAVNVSARALGRANFADEVVGSLESLGVAPQRLTIEITETALFIDPYHAAQVLTHLSSAGVRISLDDFGIGQTSLGYLSSLPVHELKVDKSFVSDMLVNTAHAAIVRSIVDLGHNLSLRVVAEGVETDEVFEALRDTSCDLAQGTLLARPMPLNELRRWLAAAPTAVTTRR